MKPIPKHENAIYIRYEDTWHGDIFCPFCGTKSIDFVDGKPEAIICPHLIFAEADAQVLLIADVFLQKLKEIIPSFTEKKANDRGTFPWPSADGGGMESISTDSFCQIVPNSITIATFDSNTGDKTVVSFVPVDVARLEPLNVKPLRLS
jgi:hypothetical protein